MIILTKEKPQNQSNNPNTPVRDPVYTTSSTTLKQEILETFASNVTSLVSTLEKDSTIRIKETEPESEPGGKYEMIRYLQFIIL